MNQYWRLYAKSRGGVALVITLALVELAAVIPVPILVRSLFDQAVHRGSARDVISIVLSLAALRLLATAASLTNRRRCLEITKDAIQRLRRTLYEKLYSLSYGRLKQRDVSELHTLVVEDTERVDVICPGFSTDCLETLEEIDQEARQAFLAAGGREFHYIPCLNARHEWIVALTEIAMRHLQGWPMATEDAAERARQRERALGMGAAR